jgi:hypothetical protein
MIITRYDKNEALEKAQEIAAQVDQKLVGKREVRLDERTVVYSADHTTPLPELRARLIRKFTIDREKL